MRAEPQDVDAIVQRVTATIGASASAWPGGWGQIELALIDAVFSIRARYGSRTPGQETGVYGAVIRWREHRGGEADDLVHLARCTTDEVLAHTNRARVSGRAKAAVVIEAAQRLVDVQVRSASDFAKHIEDAGRAYRSVKGCGPVTWRYLRMLLGEPDIKPDVWILRFLEAALNVEVTKDAAVPLLLATAGELNVNPRDLDHAIWTYQRSIGRSTATL